MMPSDLCPLVSYYTHTHTASEPVDNNTEASGCKLQDNQNPGTEVTEEPQEPLTTFLPSPSFF